jgi:hypothetical protein
MDKKVFAKSQYKAFIQNQLRSKYLVLNTSRKKKQSKHIEVIYI